MPYLFILPVFVFGAAIALAGVVATLIVPSLRHHRRLLVTVLAWATLGFVAANVVMIALMIGASTLAGWLPSGEWMMVKMMLATLIFLGPFVASIGGVWGGTVVGLGRARR